MACGGDQVPGELDKQELSEQLICPICLEVYKTPRSLRCLHAFCEGCVTSFILKAVEKGSVTSGIQCPLCREVTESPAPTKPPAEWARELPLNSAILLKLGVTESESAYQCGICTRKHKQRPAQSFCVDCNIYLCSRCVDNHKEIPILETHALMGITNVEAYPAFSLGRNELCGEHDGEKLKYFCESHKACCCSTCAIVNHRSCTTVSEIGGLGKSLKGGEQPRQMQDKFNEIQAKLAEFTTLLEQNLQEIIQQAVDIPQQIKDIRSNIIKKLDQLVDMVTSKCGQLKKQQTKEIEDKIANIRIQDAAITTSRSLLETLVKHGTETQAFIGIHRIQEQFSHYQQQMEEVQRSPVAMEIRLTVSETLSDLLKCTSLAEVCLKQTKRHVTPIRECEIMMSPLITVDKQGRLKQSGFPAAQRLADGRLLATDYYNHLCCFLDAAYSATSEVKLPPNPRDMTVMSQSEAVVVLPDTNQLQRVSVGTGLSLNGTIPCRRNPRCVSRVSDTELAVGWDQGLSIIHLDGTEKFYLDKDSSGRQIQFCSDSRLLADTVSSRLYQSACGDHAVYGMEMTGKALFTYTNNLNCPAGLALDRDRNLYVCSYGTRSVHQVGPDGQGIRIIDVGFDRPYTVFFDQTGTQMTVIQYSRTDYILGVEFRPARD